MMPTDRSLILHRFLVWCNQFKITAGPDSMLDWLLISGALDPVWVSDQDPVLDGSYLVTMIKHTRKKDIRYIAIVPWSDGMWICEDPDAVIAWQILPEPYIE